VALVDADTPTGEPQPAIIVDARFGITGMPPVADAAEQMLRAVPGFEVMEITQSEAASLAGSDGWLLAGMADDPEAGSVRVMQWLGVRNGDLIRMIAYAPTAQFDELHDTIEAVAATVAWK
jgi:hypothetical protein